jgi:hypothetical protein
MSGRQAHCEAAKNCVEQRMTMANTGKSKDFTLARSKDSRSAVPKFQQICQGALGFPLSE